MKREFLENLGLDREKIETIMSENGKSIENLRQKCTEQENRLTELQQTLSEKETQEREKEALLAEWEEKATDFNLFCDSIIKNVAEKANFTSRSAQKTAVDLMKKAALTGGDIYAVLEELRQSDPEAFGKEKNPLPIFSAPSVPEEPPSISDSGLHFVRRRI